MKAVQFNANLNQFMTSKRKKSLVNAHVFGCIILAFFSFINQGFCQDNRANDVSGTYFIQSEYQIAGNIKRRLQIEEDFINDRESVVSILSDGQEVFSGRRGSRTSDVSGTWAYVHSSRDPKENGLQLNRNATITFAPDGESFVITMKKIKVRPLGGLFANMVNAFDQTQKGVDQQTITNSMQYELAFEKDKMGMDTISYTRKK